jgi:hypothetical protein
MSLLKTNHCTALGMVRYLVFGGDGLAGRKDYGGLAGRYVEAATNERVKAFMVGVHGFVL